MVPAQSRRERKKRQTNAAIVAAARELFVTRGYDNVTIPEIAELADVGASTVFVHFRSKDEIFFKGWTAMNEDLERHVEAADPREPVLDVLRRWYIERWPAFVRATTGGATSGTGSSPGRLRSTRSAATGLRRSSG